MDNKNLELEEIIEELDVMIDLVDDIDFMKDCSVEDRHYIVNRVMEYQNKYRKLTNEWYLPKRNI